MKNHTCESNGRGNVTFKLVKADPGLDGWMILYYDRKNADIKRMKDEGERMYRAVAC